MTTNLKQALVDGAIEAAEIISSKKVQIVEDRLGDHIRGVQRHAEGLEEAIQSLQAASVLISEGYETMPAILRADLAEATARIYEEVTETAVKASRDGAIAAAELLRGDLLSQVQDLGAKLLSHLETRQKVAQEHQDDATNVALRGMAAHLGGLTRDLARNAHQELSRATAGQIKSFESQIEASLEQGRSVADEVHAIGERVRQDFEGLKETWAAAHETATAKTIDELELAAEQAFSGFQTAIDEALEDVGRSAKETLGDIKTGVFLTQEKETEKLRAQIQKHLDQIPDPKQGPPGPRGEPGQAGALTRVESWARGRVWSKGAAVNHLGGVWQACANTEEEPGASVDWVNITRGLETAWVTNEGNLILRMSDHEKLDAGNLRGPPGREWVHTGTYQKDKAYVWGEVVILRGTSYVALKDDPGECPGPDWRMVAQAKAGPAGKPGRQGHKGDPGPPGPRGPQGPPAEFWRGRYEPGRLYLEGEWTFFNNALWSALTDTDEIPRVGRDLWDLVLDAAAISGGGVASTNNTVHDIIKVTQAQYDALSPPSDTTLYVICG